MVVWSGGNRSNFGDQKCVVWAGTGSACAENGVVWAGISLGGIRPMLCGLALAQAGGNRRRRADGVLCGLARYRKGRMAVPRLCRLALRAVVWAEPEKSSAFQAAGDLEEFCCPHCCGDDTRDEQAEHFPS